MTQQEYSDLVAGHLSPDEIQRLKDRYGADVVAAVLRGEKQLHEVLRQIAHRRESVDNLQISWNPQDVQRKLPFFARYARWLVVLGIVVLMASLAAVLPRLASLSADTEFSLTDPLPLTVVVLLLAGLAAMFAMDRNDAG